MSLADVMLFDLLGNALSADQAKGDLPSFRREPLGDAARTRAALEAHPKVRAVVERVGRHPEVLTFMATRGKQGF